MRLREMQRILRSAVPRMNALKFENIVTKAGEHGTRLHYRRPALDALHEVAKIPPLEGQANAAVAGPWRELFGEPAILTNDHSNAISSPFHALLLDASSMLRVLDATLPDQSPYTV